MSRLPRVLKAPLAHVLKSRPARALMSRLPRVLLLGDSIRMSYMPIVAELLKGQAEVTGPAENCQFSVHTLARLDAWFRELGAPDVVHWNNGLHDVGHNPNREPTQYPLATYLANLRDILAELRGTGARVIWATTTPVHARRPWRDDVWSWRNEKIDRYNQAALEVMEAEGVPVNDLHALVAADPDALLAEDMLHLSEQGQRLCAEAVAQSVSLMLSA